MRPAWKKFTRRWATLAILGTAPLSTAALAEEPGLPKTRFSQAAEASFKEDDEFASLQPTPANQAPTLPETQVIAEPTAPQQPPVFNNPDPLNLPPSVLNGSVFAAQPVQGYNADSSNVGSIVNIPTLQFPGTVSTVTSDMRRDQQALRINDVLRDIGGAVFTGGDNLRPDQFFLRGMEMTSYNFRKNGFLDPTYTPRDFANVERIDVLKGPAAAVYGAAQPAGTVNITTKKAQADRFAYGSMTYGSFNLQRYAIDVNTMNDAGDMLFRLNAAYEDRGSFRDFGFNERFFVSPTFSWVLDPSTVLTVEGEYLQDRRRRDSGLIAVNGDSRAFSPNTYFGDPFDRQLFRDYRATIGLTHEINDAWKGYVGGTTLFYDAPSTGAIPQAGPGSVVAGGLFQGGTVNRGISTAERFSEQNHALIANLNGEFTDGFFEHNTVFGTEQDWFVVNRDTFNSGTALDNPQTINPFTVGPFPLQQPATSSFTFDNPGYRQNRHSLYFQDMITLNEQLKVFYGARWDHMNVTYNRQLLFAGFPLPGFNPPVSSRQTFDQGTPRVGIIYEQIPDMLTYYTTYTTSFVPPSGSLFAPGASLLLPETGRTFESGVKAQLLENLTWNVAGFYTERQNVNQQVGLFQIVQAGNQRSQGIETSLTGNWTDRWSTISNYTYNDVRNFDITGAVDGRVRGVPFDNYNVWNRYNLVQTPQSTLGLALGWVHVGKRRGDYTSPLILNAYDRWDLGAYGRVNRWNIDGYVENVFNARYEIGSINQYQVFPGAPANFRMSMSTTF